MRLYSGFKYWVFIWVFCMLVPLVPAQDTHYWNLQYGTRSNLLGGAVIGSVSDMAATYHNPAALALFSSPEILLSGKVYQYSSLTLNNGAGPGKDLTSSKVEAAPTLFAGSFLVFFLGGDCWDKVRGSFVDNSRITLE